MKFSYPWLRSHCSALLEIREEDNHKIGGGTAPCCEYILDHLKDFSEASWRQLGNCAMDKF